MLNAYKEFGVLSRTFMLEEHSKILEEIRSRGEPFRNCSENELVLAEGRIYVELVERICQLIEDFSTLCYALWNDLSHFPVNVLRKETSAVPNRLKELTGPVWWFTLLRYPDLDTLQLSIEDKEFPRQHYERNIHVLQNLAKVLERFRKLHWRFYTKHKHANPLIYGIKKVEVEGEPAIVIPAIDDEKHPERVRGIVMNYSMYKEQRKIANTVINLMKGLLDRAVLFIELDGKPIIEHVSYYKMNDEVAQRVQRLIGEYNKNIRRNPLEVTLKIDIPHEVLRQFVEFYDNLVLGSFDT